MTEKDNRPFDMLRFKADTLFSPEMGDLVASQAQAELEVLQEDPEGNAAELAVIKPMLDAEKMMHRLIEEVANQTTTAEQAQKHIATMMSLGASQTLQALRTNQLNQETHWRGEVTKVQQKAIAALKKKR